MNTIRIGSRGEEVKTLQRLLNLIADGIFGIITDEAVREYQKTHGLVVDGIVGPKTWSALMPDGVTLKKSKRTINKIILHCTASWEGQHWTVDMIRKMHIKERGWSDIGYHYVVYLDGSIHEGRDVNLVGAHTLNHNANSIGIVYVGGLRKDANGKGVCVDTRTPQQKTAIIQLVDKLCSLYGLTRKNVYGHYEFANKPCPNFDVKQEFRT